MKILSTFPRQILLWHLDTRGFSKMFDPCIGEIVNGTLEVYRMAALNLRPTPSRSHYIFNLRDFFRVIQVQNDPINKRLKKLKKKDF